MSKMKINVLANEVEEVMRKFSGNRFLLAEAFLQIIHRENILTGNRIRKRHGEPEIIPEPQMYKQKGYEKVEWIIPVPKEWISETGRHQYDTPTKRK